MDVAASAEQKNVLEKLSPEQVGASELAGEAITATFTEAPGNGMPVGGLKVVTRDGWFAARPSGTENIYKVYTESFRDRAHLARIQEEAKTIIDAVFKKAGV
jgi:phosphoglucomutase